MEPPGERFERSISEQEERMKELLDNFKTEMMERFQKQEERIATQDLKISRQSETIMKLKETLAEQKKTIDNQNETIQMEERSGSLMLPLLVQQAQRDGGRLEDGRHSRHTSRDVPRSAKKSS